MLAEGLKVRSFNAEVSLVFSNSESDLVFKLKKLLLIDWENRLPWGCFGRVISIILRITDIGVNFVQDLQEAGRFVAPFAAGISCYP